MTIIMRDASQVVPKTGTPIWFHQHADGSTWINWVSAITQKPVPVIPADLIEKIVE